MAKPTSQDQVSFDCSNADRETILEIACRAKKLGLIHAKKYSFLTCKMDVTAVHCNGNPLRLEALLAADDFNFMHDIVGIARHIDRNTGQLGDFFSPRFTQRRVAA